MVRIARIVVEGVPHHVIQRGNRRQNVFFSDEDRRSYLKLLIDKSIKYDIQVWAYCLMDNHVHLIVVPSVKENLASCIGEIHKEYTRRINLREDWRGYLWQGRFNSFVLDERHLYAAVRYVERNPVRAGLVNRAQDYVWSSARFRIKKELGDILSSFYLVDQIEDWAAYLSEENPNDLELLKQHENNGKPLGDKKFIEQLSAKLGLDLTGKKRGRPTN